VPECQRYADIFFCPFPFSGKDDRFLLPNDHWHNIRQRADTTGKNIIHQKNTNMATVNVKPLADRVLVEPAEAETKTASGIIIPDTAKEKPQRGKVLAVGDGKKDEPMTVKVGDMVLYGKYSGTEISVDGTEYLIMRESDIYAII
jgi:chaperonin GroES